MPTTTNYFELVFFKPYSFVHILRNEVMGRSASHMQSYTRNAAPRPKKGNANS